MSYVTQIGGNEIYPSEEALKSIKQKLSQINGTFVEIRDITIKLCDYINSLTLYHNSLVDKYNDLVEKYNDYISTGTPKYSNWNGSLENKILTTKPESNYNGATTYYKTGYKENYNNSTMKKFLDAFTAFPASLDIEDKNIF